MQQAFYKSVVLSTTYHPTIHVRYLNGTQGTNLNQWIGLILSSCLTELIMKELYNDSTVCFWCYSVFFDTVKHFVCHSARHGHTERDDCNCRRDCFTALQRVSRQRSDVAVSEVPRLFICLRLLHWRNLATLLVTF